MKSGIIASLVIGLVATLVGYFVAFHFGKPILDNARASTEWPTAQGVIKRSKVVTSRSNEGKTMYSADVVYRYDVDGNSFEGNTVTFGGKYSSTSNRHAYAVTKRYKPGQQVSVSYEPEFPENSVLEPGTTWMSYGVFAAGLIFLVIGVLVLLTLLGKFALGGFMIAGSLATKPGRRAPDRSGYSPGPPPGPAPPRSGPPTTNPAPTNDSEDDGFDLG